MNNWVVSLDSSKFDSLGLPWLYHARRFPGVHLHVVDSGLETYQSRQLTEEKVKLIPTVFGSYFDVWRNILEAVDGTILHTAVDDLLDPVELLDQGSERMVFGKMPAKSEYLVLCKPLMSIMVQAMTANYLEDRVANRFDGLALANRVCGPTYLWKAMVGIGQFARKNQLIEGSAAWETLAANLFAAVYPEYTLLERRKE